MKKLTAFFLVTAFLFQSCDSTTGKKITGTQKTIEPFQKTALVRRKRKIVVTDQNGAGKKPVSEIETYILENDGLFNDCNLMQTNKMHE